MKFAAALENPPRLRYPNGMRLAFLFPVFLSAFSPGLFALGDIPAAHGERDAEGGAHLWRQAVGGVVIGQPVIRGRTLALITDGGSLRAHSLTGAPLWNFSARGRLSPFLTRSPEGVSYVARTGGVLFAVNGSGRELWRTDLGGELSGPVVLGWDGRVFAAASGEIHAYTATGNRLWRRDLDFAVSSGPWPDGSGGIVLALENGDVLRAGPFGDVTAWRLPSPPSILVPVTRPGTANPSPGSPAILALHGNGDVRLIDPSGPDAAPVSLPRLPAAPIAAASRGSRAAVVLSDGQTLMLSSGGEVLWNSDSHILVHRQRGVGSVPGEVAVVYDDRGVFVLTSGGATGFTVAGGRLWLTTLRNVAGLPVLGDGVLYSGGTNWILYAWGLPEWTLARGPVSATANPETLYGTGNPPPSSFSASPMRFNNNMIGRELETVRRGIDAGNVGGNELEWISFLKETAEGGTWPGTSRSNAQPQALVTHRILALQLLSRIGSGENVPWLVRFFVREPHPAVRATAATAIGAIGFDPEGRAMDAFAAAASPGASARNEQVLLSVVAATGALCRFSGAALYDAGVRLLTLLSSSNQPTAVQRRARLELESLRPLF